MSGVKYMSQSQPLQWGLYPVVWRGSSTCWPPMGSDRPPGLKAQGDGDTDEAGECCLQNERVLLSWHQVPGHPSDSSLGIQPKNQVDPNTVCPDAQVGVCLSCGLHKLSRIGHLKLNCKLSTPSFPTLWGEH